ncbi:TPA_exp: Uncharacterized protein A8136_1000 [Trichophyton benhamiae CBS 112371]|uniref:Uncharacterized protein n=1 Tax=Arthroderma benhamiae (strain ATCC MYA-4681 / CBS 112371) TaxID=663331 RepID=D4AUW3_ARTBC|nr:uncharacterized protein ARB_08030 [Trichophyton benhamiae CBS 112371]EFE33278.1 conserved hypothetical protein [Trichophyton benhamiae CBS 112371]DAA76328.1 TPA_exp: Uncharacterized protein A8136_1000 [Trichophyton benhamiae CBS 112371]
MSAESRPIDPGAFAEALKDLPLSSVYAKIAELENSTAHLERSNGELKTFIEQTDGGDKECEDAITENEEVIRRMRERIDLVKLELERRGEQWPEEQAEREADEPEDGQGANGTASQPPSSNQQNDGPSASSQPGMEPDLNGADDTSEGVHL